MTSTLVKRVLELAETQPEKTALAFRKEAVSYASFAEQIRKAAALIRSLNVERGARVLHVPGSADGTRLAFFRNPDGTNVLVVVCDGTLVRAIQRRRLVVKYRGRYKTLPLPGGQRSVSTLLFR